MAEPLQWKDLDFLKNNFILFQSNWIAPKKNLLRTHHKHQHKNKLNQNIEYKRHIHFSRNKKQFGFNRTKSLFIFGQCKNSNTKIGAALLKWNGKGRGGGICSSYFLPEIWFLSSNVPASYHRIYDTIRAHTSKISNLKSTFAIIRSSDYSFFQHQCPKLSGFDSNNYTRNVNCTRKKENENHQSLWLFLVLPNYMLLHLNSVAISTTKVNWLLPTMLAGWQIARICVAINSIVFIEIMYKWTHFLLISQIPEY